MNRWEKGTNIPDIERLMNVAYLGKVAVPYILYGETFSKMLKKGSRISKFEKLDSFRMGLRLRKIRRDYRLERRLWKVFHRLLQNGQWTNTRTEKISQIRIVLFSMPI